MNPPTTHKSTSFIDRLRRFAPLFSGTAALAALIAIPSQAQAQTQLLSDPGAESAAPHSGTFTGWTQWGGGGAFVGDATDPGVTPNGGLNYFKIYGNYGNATDYSGFFQTFGAHAGQVFNASGYFYQLSSDGFGSGDGNNAYLEVQFKDINGAVLANYQSAHFVAGSPQNAWTSLAVTNETSLGNTLVSSLVAPTNTVQVEFDVVFNLVNYGGGSVFLDDLSLVSFAPPPPFVTNMAPANVILATNKSFTFGAVAQSGNITNIQVTVKASAGIVNPTLSTNIYTLSSSNLTVSGLGTPAITGSFPLSSNVAYSVSVLAIDSNGGSALGSASFDTVQPVFVWEAEDFNYNGGQTTSTPADGGVDLFADQIGVAGIDENWITAGGQTDLYRSSDKVSFGAPMKLRARNFSMPFPAAATPMRWTTKWATTTRAIGRITRARSRPVITIFMPAWR